MLSAALPLLFTIAGLVLGFLAGVRHERRRRAAKRNMVRARPSGWTNITTIAASEFNSLDIDHAGSIGKD